MIYQKFSPPPALAEYVRCIWTLEGMAEGDTYRLFADGCPGLLVQYGNRFSDYAPDGSLVPVPTCFFQGQTGAPRETTVSGTFGLVGVHFYPFVIPLLCATPACELTELTLDVTTLFGAAGRELDEAVQAAGTTRERIAALTTFLHTRFASLRTGDTSLRECIRHLVHMRGRVSVDGLARDTGLSARQLERKFLHTVGLPPRLTARIMRFQSAVAKADDVQVQSLTDLAYASGYSDQSHFIREFRTFAGMNPRQYFTRLCDTADSFMLLPG